MTRITFCLEEDLKKRLETRARAQRRSVSNIINLCLEEYLSRHEQPAEGPRPVATLSVLLIEDSEADAELAVRALQKAGYEPKAEVVKTAKQVYDALRLGGWDIILSDWELPGFSGLEALEIFRRSGLNTPFVILSGRIGEEAAVEAIRAGAYDYLPKDRLDKVGSVVERALAGAAKANTSFHRRPETAHHFA